MKVLIATESYAASRLGGPGRFAPGLFLGLSNVDSGFDFIGMFAGETCLTDKEIKFLDIPAGSKTNSSIFIKLKNYSIVRYILGTVLTLYKRRLAGKILERMAVDCVHAHDFRTVDLFSHFPGKIILTNHFKGSLYKESIQYKAGMNKPLLKKYYTEIERRAIRRADIITFPSKSAQLLLEEDHPDLALIISQKAIVIYSGIVPPQSVECYESNTFGHGFVLNIGNHIPDKGVVDALKVFNEVYGDRPDIHFVNVGMTGIETEKLHQEVKKLNLENRVHFLGVIPYSDVVSYLNHAVSVIHTPKRVVFDLSLLEAMAMEVPVISSRAMGNVEALGDEHPFYVEISDELPRLLFDRKSMTDDSLTACIGKQKNIFIERFSFNVMLNNYINLYSEVLPRR